MTTDAEWKDKCKLLKKKILQVEEASRISTLAIARGRVAVNRLRLEYSILLERLENKAVVPESDSEEEEELEITEGKKTIKRKKAVMLQPRDPDLPKRPLNPYLIFCDMEKDRLKREAEAEGKEIDLSKTLGEVWRNMTTEEKLPYVEVYNKDKTRYAEEMHEYESRNPKKQKISNDEAKQDASSVEP